jgi:hypothetical protein
VAQSGPSGRGARHARATPRREAGGQARKGRERREGRVAVLEQHRVGDPRDDLEPASAGAPRERLALRDGRGESRSPTRARRSTWKARRVRAIGIMGSGGVGEPCSSTTARPDPSSSEGTQGLPPWARPRLTGVRAVPSRRVGGDTSRTPGGADATVAVLPERPRVARRASTGRRPPRHGRRAGRADSVFVANTRRMRCGAPKPRADPPAVTPARRRALRLAGGRGARSSRITPRAAA